MHKLEKILKVLANHRRLTILKYLKKHSDASVGDIAEELHLSLKATSKHLNKLFGADVVDREQRRLQMFYSLARQQHTTVNHIISLL